MLDLKAGLYTMGVNSDDGFKVTLGADVIAVERPGSGAARPRPGYIVNRGKRSIELDVRHRGRSTRCSGSSRAPTH